MSAFRNVLRALVAPLLVPKRLTQLSATLEDRFERVENHILRRVVDQQQYLETMMDQLTVEQVRIRRLVAGEDVPDEERVRFPKGAPLPESVEPPENGADAAVDEEGSDCPRQEILTLEACPICHGQERSIVCHFNKMITMRRMPDAHAARYDYALCHQCGLVYASRRPAGRRFTWLLEHFEESLGRTEMNTRPAGKVALISQALDDAGRERIRQLASHGVFVSEHLGLVRKDYLWQLQADRFANSRHLELLGSMLDLKNARVLGVRSRLGSVLEGLRRIYTADVCAIPLFQNQQFIIREVYGIPADATVDFDRFTVPYEPPFDLVLSNHMLTHVVRPHEYLATLHAITRPGGHVYFYNEPDEAEYLLDEHSMFNTLNAFHLQAFNRESLIRLLAASGFQVIYVAHHGVNFMCLARRMDEPAAITPMPRQELAQRRRHYREAIDRSILQLPEHARPRFAREWPEALKNSMARGQVARDNRGQLRLMRKT